MNFARRINGIQSSAIREAGISKLAAAVKEEIEESRMGL